MFYWEVAVCSERRTMLYVILKTIVQTKQYDHQRLYGSPIRSLHYVRILPHKLYFGELYFLLYYRTLHRRQEALIMASY